MQTPYPKSALRGLITAGTILSVAACVAVTFTAFVGVTQIGLIVRWFPVALIAIFLGITMVLLRKDATRRANKSLAE